VETPQGRGVVAEYVVLRDACIVELQEGSARAEVPIDDCQEVRTR
jgi:hypothetical protein